MYGRWWQWQWQRDGHEDGTVDWPNVIDSIQTLLAIASSICWIVGEYWPYNDQPALVRVQFTLTILFAAALVAQFTSNGIRQHRHTWLLFDTVTCLPFLYQMYQLGYYGADDNRWTTFITAVRVPLQWLIVVRFLRVVRLFKRTTLRSGALVISSDVVRSVSSLLFTVFCFIIVGGGLLQLIENASVNGSQLDMWEALYTVFGVITVIGWGNPPQTTLGQVVDTVILLVAVIVLPLQINGLVNSVSDHYKLGLPYTSRAPHVVMIVYPSMTPSDLSSMLREFYSYHSGLSVYRCVLLGSGGEEHRRTLLRYIAKSKYWSSVSYVVGSPSSLSSLQKVAVQNASAVLLLSSAWFVDPSQELADDEQTLFQAISIKQYCPSVPLIISLNKPRSKAHVLWYNLCKYPNVQAVCLNEVKVALLATQAMVPGLLGLIANLLQFGGRFDTESDFSWWRYGLRSHRHTNLFTVQQLLSNHLVLGTWPLSSTVPSDKPVDRAIQRSWEMQYLTGFLIELRTCPLPAQLSGLSFADVAAALYERLLVVLLAVGRRDEQSGRIQVMLNPGYGQQMQVEHGDLLCIMVQSQEHARAVSKVHWPRETVRERWLIRKNEAAMSSAHIQFTSFGTPISAAVPMDSAVARHYRHNSMPVSSQPTSYKGEPSTALAQDEVVATFSELPLLTPRNGQLSTRPDRHVVDLPSTTNDEKKTEGTSAAMSDSTIRPPTANINQPLKRVGDANTPPLSGHIVLCGFIDSRIVSFIRRFRASDSRPLVLMFDNAVCYPLPAITQEYITANYSDVHFVYAAHTFKARHQRARVYLSYSDPHFGHHHFQRGSSHSDTDGSNGSRKYSTAAIASCVCSRGGIVESERQKLTRPLVPIDEVGPHDARILSSLIEQELIDHGIATEGEDGDSQPHLRSTPARYCRLHDSDTEPAEMDAQAVLQYANWYRRAAIQSADMVIVLASAYTAPPDSTSSNGGTALDDDTALHRDQVYITSLFQSSERSPNDAVKDDQIRADQHALILYSGIQTYLRQCSVGRHCSMLNVRAQPPPVVVELLYNINVRLLKQGELGITKWEPHVPHPVGWRWLQSLCQTTAARRFAEPIQYRYRHTRERAAKEIPSQQPPDRRKALYTSDGLTMSSRLLDSLIVQAYVDPLVYATVAALGNTYTHTIPATDWRHILPTTTHTHHTISDTIDSSDDEDVGLDKARRSFRVELMLLDVPEALVGRSFGFVQLMMIVERGWVAMGLYRDKRTLTAASDMRYSEHSFSSSPFFVFTNPPPDICLERTDRIYALVQRWLDVSTAEAMLGRAETRQTTTKSARPTIRVNSSPVAAVSIPSSYSPRKVHPSPVPTSH